MKIKKKELAKLIESYLLLEQSVHVGAGNYHYKYDKDQETIIVLGKGAREGKKDIKVKKSNKFYAGIKQELDNAGFKPPAPQAVSQKSEEQGGEEKKEGLTRGKFNLNLYYICLNYVNILFEFHNALTLGKELDSEAPTLGKEIADIAKTNKLNINITANAGNQGVQQYIDRHLARNKYLVGGNSVYMKPDFFEFWSGSLEKKDGSLAYDPNTIPSFDYKPIPAPGKEAKKLKTRNTAVESANLYLQKMLSDSTALPALASAVASIHDANISLAKSTLSLIEKDQQAKKDKNLVDKAKQFVSALERNKQSSVSMVKSLADAMISRIDIMNQKGSKSQVDDAKLFLRRHKFIGRT